MFKNIFQLHSFKINENKQLELKVQVFPVLSRLYFTSGISATIFIPV